MGEDGGGGGALDYFREVAERGKAGFLEAFAAALVSDRCDANAFNDDARIVCSVGLWRCMYLMGSPPLPLLIAATGSLAMVRPSCKFVLKKSYLKR